jgi:hypothetical protein
MVLGQQIGILAGLAQDAVHMVGVGFVAVGDLRDDRPEIGLAGEFPRSLATGDPV